VNTPAKLFVAYSHLDARFRLELEQQLKLLSRKRQISWWSEHQLVPGDERLDAISAALDEADVILMLVSIHFLANEFCWSDLLERAIKRHEERQALVIPVHVRPCPWEETPVARLQGVPREAKAISSWADKHAAWTEVARGIQQALDSYRDARIVH
jgi:hypothetical protein